MKVRVGNLPTDLSRTSLGMMADKQYKPMAKASRVSLFHREIRTSLSSAAVEILLGQAQILSEGQIQGKTFYGSTMITIDCAQAREWVSDPCDSTTSRQVGELLLKDKLFCNRVRRLGEREARKQAESSISDAQIDLSLRTSGNNLHVDIDVEASTAKRKKAS